jgi:hypothetical protein
MNGLPFRYGLLGFLGLLAISFGLGKPTMTSAAGTTIGGQPGMLFAVAGLWNDNGVDLVGAVPNSPIYESISITDASYLRVGWIVKVGNEHMLVKQLIDNPSGSDTMVVWRAQDGTSCISHASGEAVETHAFTVDIMANNVSDPTGYGLGAFKVDLTFPSNVQMIKFTPDTAWLTSTGRVPDCSFSSTWEASCFTYNNPQYGQPAWYPPGPVGSGRIARVTLLPPTSGDGTVSLAGSQITNVVGNVFDATMDDLFVRTVDCPDANGDGKISIGDLYVVAVNTNDRGVDTLVTLASAMDASATTAQISDQSKLHATPTPDPISIDAERMTVTQLTEGTPDTMTVTRAIHDTVARSHKASAHIYRATTGGIDGVMGYTRAADVDGSGLINIGDIYIIAQVPSGTRCPAPP